MYGLPVTSVDNGYALLWGHELASLDVPDYEAVGASTPHPLATAVGFVLAPLGADGAFLALRLLAALWFGLMAWSVWALARTLAGRAAAAVAVAVVVTSLVFTGAAMGSMIDVPFVALVLAATARLVRRPGEPWLPLGLLALAGLLRPEAWLLAGALVLWTAVRDRPDAARAARLVAAAAAAPLLWALSDLLVTGDPLWSLTRTQDAVDDAGLPSGLADAPEAAARYLRTMLRTPGLVAAVAGIVLALRLRPRHGGPPAAVAVMALLGFLVLGAAQLPLLDRFLLLPAAVLAVFAGYALAGWTATEGRTRRVWQALALAWGLLCLAFVPSQLERLGDVPEYLDGRRAQQEDLRSVARRLPPCAPLWTGTTAATPWLGLYGDRQAEDIRLALRPPGSGTLVVTRGDEIAGVFQPVRRAALAPRPPFRPLVRSGTWASATTCR